MKKHILAIIILISLFAGSIKAQQSHVPAFKIPPQLLHNMATDKNDSWSSISYQPELPELQFWVKRHYADSLKNIERFKNWPPNGAALHEYHQKMLARLNTTREIEWAVTGITTQNAGRYLYHVIVNDSAELVPWTKPSVFRSNKFATYAYLGKFNCRGKIITLEMYETGNYKNKAVITINSGHYPAPQIKWVMVNYDGRFNSQTYQMPYYPLQSKADVSTYNQSHVYNNGVWLKKPISFQWSSELDHIVIQMKNTPQNDRYYVALKRTIDNKTDEMKISNKWEQTEFSPDPIISINSSAFNQPGQYEIIIQPRFPGGFNDNANNLYQRIPFTVLPGPVTISVKFFLLIILIILTTGGFMFMMYRDRQKRKLAKAAQNKQIATLQLQAVRAQLNPHFIFNALAGIQNLMNKNEVENANKYLSRFARLTRNILDDSNKELISIEQETDLLSDYLQMEQMRFGFQYRLEIDNNRIDQQIEIPAMLLQPFVENAVKHGVSSLKNDGLIVVSIIKKESDLFLSVQDNGKGFNRQSTNGMGIKLCEDRIKLLNSIYKNTTILLHQSSTNNGTLITIELKDWL